MSSVQVAFFLLYAFCALTSLVGVGTMWSILRTEKATLSRREGEVVVTLLMLAFVPLANTIIAVAWFAMVFRLITAIPPHQA